MLMRELTDHSSKAYAIMPQSFTDVAELLIPELQKRGLFWTDYAAPGGSYRENLSGIVGQNEPSPDHPAHAYIWRANGETRKLKGQESGNKDLSYLDDRYATALSCR